MIGVRQDPDERRFLSGDLSEEDFVPADVVVQPHGTRDVVEAVEYAAQEGLTAVPRGGGISYSRGYTPLSPGALLVDLSAMNRILEVNETDMYVTVEAGCTWEKLYEELRGRGLRTPFFGPASGRWATVGGSTAQGNLFLGSARHGAMADSVLGLEVVLGDGRVLLTGSGAHARGTPFHRWHGPDLTGLFLGDAGTLGIKTAVTLRLIEFPTELVGVAFACDSFTAMIDAQATAARVGIAADTMGVDAFINRALAQQGMRHLEGQSWTLHMVVEGYDRGSVEAQAASLRRLLAGSGTEIAPDMLLGIREDPFGQVSTFLFGPDGQVWLPTLGMVQWSRAEQVYEGMSAAFAAEREATERFEIVNSCITMTCGSALMYERGLYWPDHLGEYRLQRSDGLWQERDRVPGAREVALSLRHAFADILADNGAANIQIGRFYPYASRLREVPRGVLDELKLGLDPGAILNAGALGLGTEATA